LPHIAPQQQATINTCNIPLKIGAEAVAFINLVEKCNMAKLMLLRVKNSNKMGHIDPLKRPRAFWEGQKQEEVGVKS